MNETLNNNIKNTGIGVILATALTALSYWVADFLGWADITSINWVVAFAVFTSYLCTWLCVHQTRWNYPVGIVSVATYSYIFWSESLFALAIFNAYLVLSLIYGWFRWGDDENTRLVTSVKWPWHLGYVALAAVIYLFLFIVHAILGQDMAWYDICLAIASGVAQFLLDNKKIETWKIWIVVNIVSIAVFLGWVDPEVNMPIVAFQYVFFLMNAFYGYYSWKKTIKSDIDLFENDINQLVFPNKPIIPQRTVTFH